MSIRSVSGEANGEIDRLPPNSLEAEQGILGCCLLSPLTCLHEAVAGLPDGGNGVFYDLRHQAVFDKLKALQNQMKTGDLITVQQELKDDGKLEQVGGIMYLSELQDAVPSVANLDYYLNIVREKFLLRKMIQTCTGVMGRIYDYEGEVDSLLDEVEKEVLAVREYRMDKGVESIKDLVTGALGEIEFMANNPGQISGVSTGFPDLDQEIDGLHPADFIIVAAYPSVGKTSFAMNVAEHFVLNLGLPVGVFSAEMSGTSLVKRILCSQAKVNLRDLRRGIGQMSIPDLLTVAGKMSKAPLYIDATSDMTIDTVRAKARRMVQQHGIKLFVADYTQLFKANDAENRTNELEKVSAGFKNIGKEFGVPVILLSQLNDDGKLKGARAIGADADVVMMLKRDDNCTNQPGMVRVNVKITKQRNGEQNVIVPLDFYKAFTRFESVPKIVEQDAQW